MEHNKHISKFPTSFEEWIEKVSVNNIVGGKPKQKNSNLRQKLKRKLASSNLIIWKTSTVLKWKYQPSNKIKKPNFMNNYQQSATVANIENTQRDSSPFQRFNYSSINSIKINVKLKWVLSERITLQARPLNVFITDLHKHYLRFFGNGRHKIKHETRWPKIQTPLQTKSPRPSWSLDLSLILTSTRIQP